MKEWINKIENSYIKDNLTTSDESLSNFRRNKYCPIFEGKPDAVFTPSTKEELIELIKIANKNNFPLVPFSSKWDFHGSSIPVLGGCVVDLRKLNKIEMIRGTALDGMSIDVEPGVTFTQANEALKNSSMRLILPLRLPSETSVVSAYYGRNAVLEANKYGHDQDWLILTYQIALAKKNYLLGIGSEGLETGGKPGDYPFSPRTDLGRVLLGAIGAFGILTRATSKIKYRPEKLTFLYASSDKVEDLIQKTREVTLHTDAGEVCFFANNRVLASYLANLKQAYDSFVEKLPSYTCVLVLAGNDDLIAVEKQDIFEYSQKCGLKVSDVEPVNGITKTLLNEFRDLKNIGVSFEFTPHIRVEFYSTAKCMIKIRAGMSDFFNKVKIDCSKVGFCANTIEMGRSYYCEYDLYYDALKDLSSKNLPMIGSLNLKDLYEQSYKRVIELGGIVNIPRNTITQKLIYPTNPDYYELLRVIKYSVDPNNIMHPSSIFNGEGGVNPKLKEKEVEA